MKLRAKDLPSFFDAVNEKGKGNGVAVTTAVVGPEGHLIALERMDDAGFITPDTAIAKAYTGCGLPLDESPLPGWPS